MPTKQGESTCDLFKAVFGPAMSVTLESVSPSSTSPSPSRKIPKVKRVIYHEPATVIYWEDGTKTIAKCMEGQPFEKYAGFCAAVTKKIFGGTTTAKRIAGAKDEPVKAESEEVATEESNTKGVFIEEIFLNA